eukprot:1360129-Prorocentrum_lima.AAC.1
MREVPWQGVFSREGESERHQNNKDNNRMRPTSGKGVALHERSEGERREPPVCGKCEGTQSKQ